jgi:glycosyltransferase involved in cell wall biosynthesis
MPFDLDWKSWGTCSVNILQVGTFPYPSPQGSQVYVRGIVRGLAQMGHQVDLLCYGHGIGDTTLEQSLGVQIWRAPNVKGYQNMRAGPDWVKPLLDVLMAMKMRHCRPDVIHVHNYEAPFVVWMAKMLFPHLRGIPVVYSAHNTMAEELPTYFSSSTQKKWSARLGRVLDLQIPKRHGCAVVLRTQSETALQRLGCRQVRTVSPGIDPDEFLSLSELKSRVPTEMQEGQWIVYAGNPDAYQDLDILMEALNRLPDVHLVFVSASDARHWQRQNGRVLHIQTSDFHDVQAMVQAADLAVIPRMQCTGFPIKLLNYLALGTMTICSEGSAVELPGVIAIPNGDIDAMVASIAYYLKHSDQRCALGKQAREHVLQSCTWAVQAQQLTEIYEGLRD